MTPNATGTTTRSVEARLPCGVADDGSGRVRLLRLRPVGPEDDDFLLDTRDTPRGLRATALLARCLDDEDGSLTRSLTIGDREALLLQLRARTLGEYVEGVVNCPEIACRAGLEFRLRTDDLLLPPYDDDVGGRLTIDLDGTTVAFRLPRVGDLEDALAESPEDEARTRDLLLARCVDHDARASSGKVLDRVGEAMAELDPQAELQIELACTECGHRFWFVLDTGAFLVDELDAGTDELAWEIHVLASHYHWSEAAILAMPAARRQVYLNLLELTAPPAVGFGLHPVGTALQ
jgi:hypothetical protein